MPLPQFVELLGPGEQEAYELAGAASIAEATADVVSRFPDLNVLVAMAGIMRPEDWTTRGFLADAEETVVTNVLGPIRLIDALVPQLRERPGATILTVSSGLAHTPLRFTPTYNATKAAIHQYVDEVMALLEADPKAREVLVEQVKLLRFAEVRGDYDQIIGDLNAAEERVR